MREYERGYISAKYLLSPIPARVDTVDTTGVKITQCPARVARGAYKPKIANRGDAPTISHASRTTGTIRAVADRRVLLAYAYRGVKG